ncbi:hypothetical protein [Kitasatospora sp. NPDC091207]|uniref:hypothetical protein n=1 Tax=Kitasatospora sp. NPDC091207 TaxID=3364083 RepID=UPI003821D879
MHHPDLTRYGTNAEADRAVLNGGLAMAWTAITLASRETHRASLVERLGRRPRGADLGRLGTRAGRGRG